MKLKGLFISALNAIIRSKPYMALQMLHNGDLEYQLFRDVQFLLSVAEQHKSVFPQFKNKHIGQDIVILACGPTLNDYQDIPNTIKIAVNRTILSDKFQDCDYWFMQDFGNATREEKDRYIAYKGKNCIKFIGVSNPVDTRWGYDPHAPSELDICRAGAYKYFHDYNTGIKGWQSEFAYDLSTMPLANCGTIVFSALQFALWTNPRRIYLVGCDSTATGHFYNKSEKTGLPPSKAMRASYQRFRNFAANFYPETEIISVNPIGLKGIFHDWNQADGTLS